ncbi:MAG: inorganic phosphate transporter family protein [Deltaproteobacteria bacterium]|nr:inorganic phosphate transporter family protein [Deltaproteobacteria bacterium]
MFLFFLSSGLFLGWSLGANDASNVFGTAVGSKMIRFRTAAICCSLFIILGAVMSGSGASHTLGRLGSINAIAGAFIVAFAAAISVYSMTKLGYPVSTSQAIVGAIIGWNFFSGSLTDYHTLLKIVLTWVACPMLSAVIALALHKTIVFFIRRIKIDMFRLDAVTRYGLLVIGAFGSYSLGANNIANVMGVFVPVSPFADISIFGLFRLSSTQQLFFIGGIAIGIGVLTYSRKVMETVGEGIMDLSPIAALVVVAAHSLVLFLFASQGLETFLKQHGLPTIPLVPVSSSQAIVGAVIGIGLLKRGRGIRWRVLGGIGSSWVVTPVIAALVSFVALFFLQNVFEQKTYRPVSYLLTAEAMARIQQKGIVLDELEGLAGKEFPDAVHFMRALEANGHLTPEDEAFILESAEIDPMEITTGNLDTIDFNPNWITAREKDDLKKLEGRYFKHKWQLREALAHLSPRWKPIEGDKRHNDILLNKLTHIYDKLRLGD